VEYVPRWKMTDDLEHYYRKVRDVMMTNAFNIDLKLRKKAIVAALFRLSPSESETLEADQRTKVADRNRQRIAIVSVETFIERGEYLLDVPSYASNIWVCAR